MSRAGDALMPFQDWRDWLSRVRRDRLDSNSAMILFRALAELIRAGAPLDRALTTASSLLPPKSRGAVAGVQLRVRLGQSLSAALVSPDTVVPAAVIGLLKAGERGRGVEAALERSARLLEQRAEARSTIGQALAYPALLLVAGIGATVILGGVVAPRMTGVLQDMGQTVPPMLRLVSSGAGLMRRYSLFLFALSAGTVVGVARLSQSPEARTRMFSLLYRVPLVGPALRDVGAARFAQTLGELIASGVPLPEALPLAGEASGVPGIHAATFGVRARLLVGESLSSALQESRMLPDTIVAFVRIGEAGDGLSTTCQQAADICRGSAVRRLKTAVAMLEPALILSIAGVVGVIASSLLRAVYAIRVSGP